MDADYAEQRLTDAEISMARALHRLHAVRRAALTEGYDSMEHDRALVGYRLAERNVRAARRTVAEAHTGQVARPAQPEPPVRGASSLLEAPAVTAPHGGTPSAGPFEPTPRMRFARWLVQTGRLSDELSASAPAGTSSFGAPEERSTKEQLGLA